MPNGQDAGAYRQQPAQRAYGQPSSDAGYQQRGGYRQSAPRDASRHVSGQSASRQPARPAPREQAPAGRASARQDGYGHPADVQARGTSPRYREDERRYRASRPEQDRAIPESAYRSEGSRGAGTPNRTSEGTMRASRRGYEQGYERGSGRGYEQRYDRGREQGYNRGYDGEYQRQRPQRQEGPSRYRGDAPDRASGRSTGRDFDRGGSRYRDDRRGAAPTRGRAPRQRDAMPYPGIPSASGRRMQQGAGFDITAVFGILRWVGAGVAVFLVGIFIFFALPITVHVNGGEASVSRWTTYQGLLDQGVLDATAGNLLAVDGALLEEGKGDKPTVYNNGNQVDLGSLVSDSGDITAQSGADATEPFTETQEIEPVQTRILKDKDFPDQGFNFYNGILHLAVKPGQDGITSTRTGQISGITATVKVQDMEPRTIDNISAKLPEDQKLVAITFDDGPNPNTGGTREILDVLKKNDVKATFFMIGTEVEEFPDLAREVAEAGNQVASHLYSHEASKGLDQCSQEVAREQVVKAREVIGQAVGYEPTLVRPTGGNVKVESIEAIGNQADGYICWSLDTFDYNKPGVDAIVKTVVDGVFPGAVVLMHDGGGDRSQTAQALEKILPQLKQAGYQCVTIDELIQARMAVGDVGEQSE